MTVMDDDDVQRRLDRLADELTTAGALRSAQWGRVFRAVRRHVFVPRYWHDEQPGAFPARWRMVDHATRDHGEWLQAVYSDRTLPTELTGVPARTGEGMHPQVTSSSTMPGLVMAMLEDLDVADGMHVLQIGTGSGYTAALLCERLGEANVTSIDVSPELVALARVRLAAHGYRPRLVSGDGAAGVPQRAPFDRVIATCGVADIPTRWIEQTRDGGKLLVNLLGSFNPYALVLLTIDAGRASGKLLRQRGTFMPMRPDPQPRAEDAPIHREASETANGHSPLDPQDLYADQTLGLLAQTQLHDVRCRRVYVDAGPHLGTELATPDGSSWALVHHAQDDHGYATRQAGPRQLWHEIEQVHERWTALGSPASHRFGLTIDHTSHPRLWLDHPSNTAW